MADKDETKDDKWIRWKDLNNCDVRMRPNAIIGTVRSSNLIRNPQGQQIPSTILCMGVISPVSEQTIDDVLMALGQESWIKQQ